MRPAVWVGEEVGMGGIMLRLGIRVVMGLRSDLV